MIGSRKMIANSIGIVALLLFIVAMWVVFLRPVPRLTSVGVITAKIFKPAGVYQQFPVGERTNFRTPTSIPIAECYVFNIDVDGEVAPAAFTLNTTAAERFEIGQRVSVVYELRGIPFIWTVACVIQMEHATQVDQSHS